MKDKWLVAAKKADFNAWAEEFGISPVIARIIRNREITQKEDVRKFLYGDRKDLYSPWLLKDMDLAIKVITDAKQKGLRIRVIGDYDVDGICASYILTKGLELLGASVDTAIPHRIHDGYGLNDQLIRDAAEDGIGLIITCDNGIAAADQIKLARELGIGVVVTDHHEIPYVMENGEKKACLPPALAVVDPGREDDQYPLRGICGAVIAYKVIQALSESFPVLSEGIEELLEFAAFATVCDVMELRDENRVLVKEGIKCLRKTKNQGLKALIDVNGLEQESISAYHLGFVLGPCLNATGRLDTAQKALSLLRCTDRFTAVEAARELKDLNDSRKNLTSEGVLRAIDQISAQQMEGDKVYVIYLPEVHESLAGIIAGRIREHFCHPVFVLTKGEDGIKGSGRSIEAYHMYDAMTEVKHLFTKYGGHKMAAGLSMADEEDVKRLRSELNMRCKLTNDDFVPVIHIDVPMPIGYASMELAKQLELLEPFGVGNPKPLFAQKGICFLSGVAFGKKKQYARFRIRTPEGEIGEMIYFGEPEKFVAALDEKYGVGSGQKLFAEGGEFKMDVVYQLGRNTYKGRDELQFIIQSFC